MTATAVELADLDGYPVVACADSRGTILVWFDGRLCARIEADCAVTSLAFLPPRDLAVGAGEGLMLIRLSIDRGA